MTCMTRCGCAAQDGLQSTAWTETAFGYPIRTDVMRLLLEHGADMDFAAPWVSE